MSLATTAIDVLLVVGLILLNGLFVAAELALVTSRRTRIDQLGAEGSRMAAIVRAAMDRPIIFISGTQVGITMASLILGWVGEPTVAAIIEPVFFAVPGLEGVVPHNVLLAIATAFAFFVITFFHILLGETVPKSISIFRPEGVALITVPIVLLFARVARPLIWLVNASSELILRVFGMQQSHGRHAVHTEAEIQALINESRQAGVVGDEEAELVRRVFRFGDRIARDVMVPRTRVEGVEASQGLPEVVATVIRTGFNHLPVFDGNLDNIVGVVSAKEVLVALSREPRPATAAEFMRPAYVIPESKELAELLPDLRAQGTQMAVVLDEFGGTAGILTIEDLVEEVVGEIVSEYGTERRFIHRQTEQELLVDAEMNLDDLNELWDLTLPTDEVDTIGGLVYQQLGHVPTAGESFLFAGLTFSVRSMRGHAIGIVRIARAVGEHGSV